MTPFLIGPENIAMLAKCMFVKWSDVLDPALNSMHTSIGDVIQVLASQNWRSVFNACGVYDLDYGDDYFSTEEQYVGAAKLACMDLSGKPTIDICGADTLLSFYMSASSEADDWKGADGFSNNVARFCCDRLKYRIDRGIRWKLEKLTGVNKRLTYDIDKRIYRFSDIPLAIDSQP